MSGIDNFIFSRYFLKFSNLSVFEHLGGVVGPFPNPSAGTHGRHPVTCGVYHTLGTLQISMHPRFCWLITYRNLDIYNFVLFI
jgi:hypothetical protein